MVKAAGQLAGITSSQKGLVFSCEHGGNEIPAAFQELFCEQRYWLNTHRGWDPGALQAAQFVSARLGAQLISTQWSRLLVDCNREEDHAEVFGPLFAKLPPATREGILAQYHRPYRLKVQRHIADLIAGDRQVLHVSLHSFTPRMNGTERDCELGIMFDDRIPAEMKLAGKLQADLEKVDSRFRIRLNYPYVGKSTYFQPALRRQFAPDSYLALQLEVNQKVPRQQKARWNRFQRALAESLRSI